MQHSRVLGKHGPKKLGGMNRTEGSRKYLFSSLLRCGLRGENGDVCNANMVVVVSKAPYVYYGCPIHRMSGNCMNKLLIRQSSLEEQLLGAIVASLRAPESLALLREEFTHQLEQGAKDDSAAANQALGSHDALRKENVTLNRTVENLTIAIAEHGLSHALSAKLRQSEVRMEEITRLLAVKDKLRTAWPASSPTTPPSSTWPPASPSVRSPTSIWPPSSTAIHSLPAPTVPFSH